MTHEIFLSLGQTFGLGLRVATLPGQELASGLPLLVERSSGVDEGIACGRLQLLEEAEYTYEVVGCSTEVVLEPVEVFNPSNASGHTGRLRPGRATGTITVVARSTTGTLLGTGNVEVRSRKLNYLSEYRWMLQRIADEAAEAAQSHFAPSALPAFSPSTEGHAETLYQRFSFVRALLGSAEFDAALQLVVRRPHHDYVAVAEAANPRRGLKGDSSLHRELARFGPRQSFAASHIPGLHSLPTAVRRTAHIQTVDTVPNRFVAYALRTWRSLAHDVSRACGARSGPAARRGQVEANALADQLDEYLHDSLFRNVSELSAFPAEDTVLQRRPGYRDIFRAYLQAEAAALVDWLGSRDTFTAGQRDVAALYEYWAFLELSRVVGGCPGFILDRRTLFRRQRDRLSLELRRGKPAVLRADGTRRGRTVQLELWFNRHFGKDESWTEPMRPDCSLLISSQVATGSPLSKWMHFDAKYRINAYSDVFQAVADASAEPVEAKPVSADLLKMHAYRDAIRRTSGAYVLYPGGNEPSTRHTQYHEILPGLGAFVLRPAENGQASSQAAQSLRQFIEDAIDHLVACGTDEERSRYWHDRVYRERQGRRLDQPDWTGMPPADVSVLLAFTRGNDHRTWIQRTQQYNLRADNRAGSVRLHSPELTADLICLYDAGVDEVWLYGSSRTFVVRTATELVEDGYPYRPGSSLYCCILLDSPISTVHGVNGRTIRTLARRGRPPRLWAAPRLTSLADVLGEAD